jgi:hypothetical protein
MDSGVIFMAVVVVLFCLWWTRKLIRRMVFTATDFSVERYIWLTKTYHYSEVIDIGVTQIKTRRGTIGMEGMNNGFELRKLFVQLIQQDIIHYSQLENKLFDKQRIQIKSTLPALLISLIPWSVLLYFYRPYFFHYSALASVLIVTLSWMLFYLLSVSVVSPIIKRKLEKQKK